MIGLIFKKAIGSATGRWITLGVVTLLLGSGGLMWHNFKQGLIDEGTQVCVQVINEQTVIDLQAALAAERETAATLRAEAAANAAVNEEARTRLRDSESNVADLNRQIKEQRKNDETYKAWSDTPLPDGVADRLRRAGTGSSPDTGREDSN